MSAVLIGKVALLLLGMLAGWLDITVRRLPNWLCLLTLAAGLLVTFFDMGVTALGSHLAHMAIALLFGMVLFGFGVIGGGDAKFYAAVASWFKLSDGAGLLLSVALSGLVLFLCWFTWRRIQRKPIRPPSPDSNEDKLPYGVAIAAGAVVQYFRVMA